MHMKNFKTYQLSIDLFHEFRKLKMPAFLHDQLLRASSSVALNLAEGSGKRTPKDQRKFYYQAYGSLRECKAILELMKIKDEKLLASVELVGAHIWKLISYYNKTEN